MKPEVEWLNTMAKSGRVTRYHNTPMITRQTIADHTWGVVLCLLWLTDGEVNNAIMKAAIYHDCPEIETGDIPAPAKVQNGVLRDALDDIESRFINSMNIGVELEEWESEIISIADTMELLLHCKKEIVMGNRHAQRVFNKGFSYLIDKVTNFKQCDIGFTLMPDKFRYIVKQAESFLAEIQLWEPV